MKYAVVIERTPHNYSAYVPDLPGCVTVGDTLEEAEHNIREAIAFHLDGLPIPGPQPVVCTVEVGPPAAPAIKARPTGASPE